MFFLLSAQRAAKLNIFIIIRLYQWINLFYLKLGPHWVPIRSPFHVGTVEGGEGGSSVLEIDTFDHEISVEQFSSPPAFFIEKRKLRGVKSFPSSITLTIVVVWIHT